MPSRRSLWLAAAVAAVCALPAAASAATVTLTSNTSVILPSDGSSYTLSSGGAFDNLAVSGGTMTFTMSQGESVTITGGNYQVLSNSQGGYNCGAPSTLTLDPSTSSTITVTPGGTCALGATSGQSDNGAGGGGGGGSSTATKSTEPSVTTTVAPVPSGLSANQVKAVLALLTSFGADTGTISSVEAALSGQPTTAASSSSTFARNLERGSTGPDVEQLQQYLDDHGYPVAESGPGSPGQETTYFGTATENALAQLQAAAGITPAAGYFGPITRAYIASHP